MSFPRFVDDWIIKHLLFNKNAKNINLVYVLVNIVLTSIPAAILLFSICDNTMNKLWMHVVGFAYTAFTLITWTKSFILCMHYAAHTPVFKRNLTIVNNFMPYCLCTLFGILPGQYYLHHIVMHHKENNIFPYDLSATMHYDRSKRSHMIHYCLRYFLGIYFELPYYAFKRKRYDLCRKSIMQVAGTITVYSVLFYARPVPTLYVFLLPMLIIAYALMEGNWSQHIFVSPDVSKASDKELPYSITYTCLHSKNNAYTFNDGYHIEHHAQPTCPWYDLPSIYNEKEYEKYDGIAFKTIDIDTVRELVFANKLEELANYYVNVKNRSKDEIVDFFRSRLRPVR